MQLYAADAGLQSTVSTFAFSSGQRTWPIHCQWHRGTFQIFQVSLNGQPDLTWSIIIDNMFGLLIIELIRSMLRQACPCPVDCGYLEFEKAGFLQPPLSRPLPERTPPRPANHPKPHQIPGAGAPPPPLLLFLQRPIAITLLLLLLLLLLLF